MLLTFSFPLGSGMHLFPPPPQVGARSCARLGPTSSSSFSAGLQRLPPLESPSRLGHSGGRVCWAARRRALEPSIDFYSR